MSEQYLVTFNLELNVEQAEAEIRKLQTLLFRTMTLMRRLGLPEQIDHAIARAMTKGKGKHTTAINWLWKDEIYQVKHGILMNTLRMLNMTFWACFRRDFESMLCRNLICFRKFR